MAKATIFQAHADAISSHRTWLAQFEHWRRTSWEQLLDNEPEAAICEAETRKFLSEQGIKVEPFEEQTRGGPDFACASSDDEALFYVEVTCLNAEAISKKTGLYAQPASVRKGRYCLLTQQIFNKCTDKVRQLANLDRPALLATATLNWEASSIICSFSQIRDVFFGETKTVRIESSAEGELRGSLLTQCRNSAFVTPQTETPRKPISGLLLCGFARQTPRVVGLIHPCPARPFDRSALPQVPFHRLLIKEGGAQLEVECC